MIKIKDFNLNEVCDHSDRAKLLEKKINEFMKENKISDGYVINVAWSNPYMAYLVYMTID